MARHKGAEAYMYCTHVRTNRKLLPFIGKAMKGIVGDPAI